jgi:DNA-binding MarR family transcriptional regulator
MMRARHRPMATAPRPPVDPDAESLNLGHLLLVAFHGVVDDLFRRLTAHGYTDLRPAHSRVFEHLRDEGSRVSELADRAQMTHQSMSELVAHLERCGYLERGPDPRDRRAKAVLLTPRGRALSRRAAACMDEIEADWCQRLGGQSMRIVRAALAAAVATPVAVRPPDSDDR